MHETYLFHFFSHPYSYDITGFEAIVNESIRVRIRVSLYTQNNISVGLSIRYFSVGLSVSYLHRYLELFGCQFHVVHFVTHRFTHRQTCH